ncbi:MAG TPA: hypothetical protein VJ482_12750 [Acidimicrobiia bacterium]|nr:hypothetical protein [Acidimicrobiia bacterium]
MEELSYKVRISALWLLHIVAFFAYRTLAVSEGATEVSLLSNDEFATYLLVAMAFAFLSLTLTSRPNRSTNIIAGAIFGVAQLIMLADGIVGYASATFNLMTGASFVIMASVIWFAYKWPKAASMGSREKTLVDEAQRV